MLSAAEVNGFCSARGRTGAQTKAERYLLTVDENAVAKCAALRFGLVLVC